MFFSLRISMRLFQIQDLNEVLGRNLIQNQAPHQKPHLESRTSSRTSSKNQDLGQDLIEILIEILNEDFFLIKNLNECPKNFDEILDEVLDFWWSS